MSEITLEKVDLVRERTGVSYSEAKEALELSNGEVVDALIYLESKAKEKGNFYKTKDELIAWLKETINKGNVTRIKIKKDDKTLVDLPVNAGIAVTGLTAALSTPLLAIGVLTAVVTKLTIEITKEDGTVEVVNTYIKNTVDDVKGKFSNITEKIEEVTEDVVNKINVVTDEIKDKFNKNKNDNNNNNSNTADNNIYKYTVKFEEVDEEKNEEKSEEKNEEKSDN